jgi:hypothetical protein
VPFPCAERSICVNKGAEFLALGIVLP